MTDQTYSYRVGDSTVMRVFEKLIPSFAPSALFPGWEDEKHAQQLPSVCWDGQHQSLALSTHGWLVRTPHHNVLIDAGIGNGKARKSPMFDRLNEPFLERLAAGGVKPEQIDYVLLTHLHTDHVGWNTVLRDGRWEPTFPNAKYVFSKVEDALFSGPGGRERPNYAIYEDSVLPVIESGQAMMIDGGGGEFVDGFFFHPTPGHSPDHLSISLDSGGAKALFAGDVIHLPVQVGFPELSSCFSADPERGHRSRLWALEYAAKNSALFFSSHCPGTSVGCIERNGARFGWRFV